MKRMLAFLIVVCLGLSLASCRIGTEHYPDAELYEVGDLRYEATQVHTVKLYWEAGSVQLSHSEDAYLNVSEDKGNLTDAQRMHCLLRDGVLTVRFCESGYRGRIRAEDKNLEIQIPKNVAVTVVSASADVFAGELCGTEVSLTTVSGQIGIATLNAETATVSSVSGDVRVDRLQAEAFSASNVSGNMDFPSVQVDVTQIATTSGEVQLSPINASTVSVSSVSGDVTIQTGTAGLCLNFSTVSGDLTTPLRYEEKDGKKYFGDGSVAVSVETVSGNVYVHS